MLGSVLQPELFADKNATSLQSIIFQWEYYQQEYLLLRARPVLHTGHSLCLGLCVVEGHAVPCTGEFCWLFVCLFVPIRHWKKWKSRSPIMITSESRRASPLSLRAVKLWLSLISFSPFVFFDHPHYWGRIQIVNFPPGRKSGCLHTPRVCSPRTVEGGTSNRPSCPWTKNLFQARGSVEVQNRKRVSVTFENICKRAQCFFPRPFGSAAPHLSFTIKNCNNLPPFCERITWEMR